MMRIFHKIPMLLIVLCAQVNMMMAQEAKPEVVPDVWGTYEGEATMELFDRTTETKTPNGKKQMVIEISKGERQFTVLTLKDVTIGQYEFASIPFKDCYLLRNNNKWHVEAYNNLDDEVATKDKQHTVWLSGSIDEKESCVDKEGNLELSFFLSFKEDSHIQYVFKGKKKSSPTGIDHVNAYKKTPEVFDLQGRRVSKIGKGVYIVNGKKVVF
ncbi:alpha-amylase [Hallella colorans]|uniref:alpha-amylase n=1 Tax=Hallella colorans TaxID=1703337 RepID=UPI0023F1ABA6|nr:alpha-amylase [Hallella colorans]